MQRVFKKLALVYLALIFALPALAEDKAELVAKVLYQSGLDSALEQFPALMAEGLRQHSKQSATIDKKVLANLNKAIEKSFSLPTMKQSVSDAVSEGMSSPQLQEVLNWLNTPLGQRVVQLEVSALDTDQQSDIENMVVALQQEYRGTEREQLFAEYDRTTGATQMAVDTAIAMQLTLGQAIAATVDNPALPSVAEMEAMIESNRFMLRGMIGQQVYGSYLYTYRDLSISELKEYVGWTGTPTGMHFNRVAGEAIKKALMEPAREMGRYIAEASLKANNG